MTAPALAAMALRFDAPVIGGWVERLGPARLQLHVTPRLALPAGERIGDSGPGAVTALTQAINDQLESWIRQCPQAWLWLHRRWPKDVYKPIEIKR